MNSRPNLLLVFADQMRGEAMRCAGNQQAHTPALDALAAQGMLFTNAIANCPVCTPSRASLLTGKYPLGCRTVVNDLALPEDEVTFAGVMGATGYRTGYVGKWHLDGISRHKFTPPGRRRHGFDSFWAAYNCTHAYFDTKYYLDTPEIVRVPDTYEPDVQTDLAIEFLDGYRDEPFCLVLSWGPPHDPYDQVPDRFRAMYGPAKLALRPNCPADLGANERRAIADYYAAVTALDRNFGRLMHALDRRGLAGNTIVVFTSDHGDMLWSHNRRRKQQPWEECINIPLIVRWPGGVPAGAKSDSLIGIADLAPTLLGLAGLAAPDFMEGTDLSHVLPLSRSPRSSRSPRGHPGTEYESVPIMDLVPVDQAPLWGGQPWRGVRTRRYTYARERERRLVLYDNLRDPFQMTNLSEDPAHASIRDALEIELQHWLHRLNDPFPTADGCLELLGQADAFRQRQEHFAAGGNW